MEEKTGKSEMSGTSDTPRTQNIQESTNSSKEHMGELREALK